MAGIGEVSFLYRSVFELVLVYKGLTGHEMDEKRAPGVIQKPPFSSVLVA